MDINEETYNYVADRMLEVDDPEIGINIFDLGLLRSATRTSDKTISVTLVPTSPGCPYTEDIKQSLVEAFRKDGVEAEIVWQPIPSWSAENITDSGRTQLRALGASIPYYA